VSLCGKPAVPGGDGLIHIKSGVAGGAFVAEMGPKLVSDSLSNMMRLGKVNIQDVWDSNVAGAKYRSPGGPRSHDWDIKQMEELVMTREKAVKARKHRSSRTSISTSPLRVHQEPARHPGHGDDRGNPHGTHEAIHLQPERYQHINKFHREILEAIKKRDADRWMSCSVTISVNQGEA